jgi:hypothetical protein
MAGLIDTSLIRPELAGSFAAGYRGAEQARQQSAQAEQQLARGRQQMQMDEMTMKRLQEDRAAMLQLQERLKAAGQDPDLDKIFDAFRESGIPDYVVKGVEGKRRLQEQREFARIQGLDMPGAAAPTGGAVAPAAAPAVAPMPEGELVAAPIRPYPPAIPMTAATPAPAPAVAPGPAGETSLAYLRRISGTPAAAAAPASTNALTAPAPTAAVPGGPAPQLIAQTQGRINRLMQFAATASPQAATNAMAQARILQDQLELYSRPARADANKPASLQELDAYMSMTPEQKAAFEKLQKIKQPNVSASATAAGSPTGKSLSAEVGQRASTSLVKAEGAAGIMENANMVREALNTGNVIAGPLAGVRTKFAQVLEVAGAGDKEKLVNTRNTIQGLASLTLESRAELKGQGQITDTETKLLERARSADIGELTIPELQQVVNIAQRLANRMWSNHQSLLRTMRTDPAAADSIRYYEPTMSLPQAIGEGKSQAEVDKRTQGLADIFKPKPR